jgi:small subunit ribosomal protein S17
MSAQKNSGKKIGIVVSTKNDKTITVLTKRKSMNRLYKKHVIKCSKIMAHDENNICNVGDEVAIVGCRPISKNKKWRLDKVLNKKIQ